MKERVGRKESCLAGTKAQNVTKDSHVEDEGGEEAKAGDGDTKTCRIMEVRREEASMRYLSKEVREGN
jgi:hypothetical protein